MSDWDTSFEDEEDEDKIISLEDLESLEHDQERRDDPFFNEEDWGDSYDDLDNKTWEKQYRQEDEEMERDPWELG